MNSRTNSYEVTSRNNSESVDANFLINDCHIGPFTIGPMTTKTQALERAVKLFLLCDVNSCHPDVIAILSAGINEVARKWGWPDLAAEAKMMALEHVMREMFAPSAIAE